MIAHVFTYARLQVGREIVLSPDVNSGQCHATRSILHCTHATKKELNHLIVSNNLRGGSQCQTLTIGCFCIVLKNAIKSLIPRTSRWRQHELGTKPFSSRHHGSVRISCLVHNAEKSYSSTLQAEFCVSSGLRLTTVRENTTMVQRTLLPKLLNHGNILAF